MTTTALAITIAARATAWALVQALDATAQATAWALGPVSRVSGAGVTYWPQGSAFVDVWRESTEGIGGSAWTLRLGRLEAVVDLRA